MRFQKEKPAPFDGLIYYTEKAYESGQFTRQKADEIIARFQRLNVAALTKASKAYLEKKEAK